MRIALPLLLSVLGCGRAEFLDPPALAQPPPVEQPPVISPVSNELRLRSSWDRSDGFRFSDRAIITSRTFAVGGDIVTEVSASDGTLVAGEAARVDLQTDSGRFFVLRSNGGEFCVIRRPVNSLTEVSVNDCLQWKSSELFQLSQSGDSMGATGLVIRTDWNTAYRVRILESGLVESTSSDDMLFEFEPYPALAQCVIEAGCVVSADCCNRRHTCTSGRCAY